MQVKHLSDARRRLERARLASLVAQCLTLPALLVYGLSPSTASGVALIAVLTLAHALESLATLRIADMLDAGRVRFDGSVAIGTLWATALVAAALLYRGSRPVDVAVGVVLVSLFAATQAAWSTRAHEVLVAQDHAAPVIGTAVLSYALGAVVAFQWLGASGARHASMWLEPTLAIPAHVALLVVRYLLAESLLRGARPGATSGRLAPWRHPGPRPLAWLLDFVANSRVLGALLEPLPVVAMESDVTNVIYVNYLVPAEKLLDLVPEGLELQRLGPGGRYALFTFLTYRHGHFGFSFLGPLRRLFPDCVQSNWRVHVTDPRTGLRGIRFVTNAIDRTAPALGARLLSEGMPMHVFARASLDRDADGATRMHLDPGGGSAPDATGAFVDAPRDAGGVYRDASVWDGAWSECFPDLRAFLEYCVSQDRAMDVQPLKNRVSRQEIHLGIAVERCVPLRGSVASRAATALVGDATPVCFRVPDVRFRFRLEAYDPITRDASA